MAMIDVATASCPHSGCVIMSIDHPPAMMSCMEVWGGNQATERAFATLGLETWVYSRPYQQAAGGGDVYFVSSCATGRITRLLVADISGHGASLAATGERLRSLMRQHVNHVEQRQFMAEMNREFGTVRHAGGFATAVAASFFAPDGGLIVTNAGHPPPLIFRRGSWSLLDLESQSDELTDMPLGMLDEMAYEEIRVDAQPGNLLLFYTDSLIEARGASGEMLGPTGLLSLIQSLDSTHAETLIPTLLERIAKINPDNLTDDDVTVLLFRPTGTGTAPPIWNRIKAPWLFMAACLRAVVQWERLPLPEFTWANFGGALFSGWSHKRRPQRENPHP